MSKTQAQSLPGAPSLRVLCARVGFHNCPVHGILIAQYPAKHPRPRHQWNPTPSTPLRAGSNVEERDVRMGHPAHTLLSLAPSSHRR
jgi:hypothetical protein